MRQKRLRIGVGLAKQGFYDGTPFARVIKDFVIQGGALDGSGDEATSIYGGYFEDEVDEGLYHFDGAVCLGNHGPNTNGISSISWNEIISTTTSYTV